MEVQGQGQHMLSRHTLLVQAGNPETQSAGVDFLNVCFKGKIADNYVAELPTRPTTMQLGVLHWLRCTPWHRYWNARVYPCDVQRLRLVGCPDCQTFTF